MREGDRYRGDGLLPGRFVRTRIPRFALSCLFTLFVAIPCLAEDPQITPEELAAVKAAEAARIQAIESVYGAVVAIYGNNRQGGGSGVLFDPAGCALTNHHVIAGAGDGGWAGLADGKLYRWKLVGTDPGGDVAIIKLSGNDAFPVAPLGDSNTVRVGDWAMAMGNPFTLAEDQKPTVTLGIVSGVNRYQGGSGLNQLVYGNCIQVDSSINPGNSGGPLFNMRGEIIGINGRGSFEERGRVNVGLGYAISSNQIKNFIPELLATKIAQHGTLDAVFGNRAGGVICFTMNLNAPIAKAGLQLGDRLVAFEGQPIRNANELTNLISTYPAGWPAEVTYEHDGVRKTAHVRLTPLPYVRAVRRVGPGEEKPAEPPMPQDRQPGEKPRDDRGQEKPSEEHPGEKKPGEQPSEQPRRPRLPVERPGLPLDEAGKIRDAELNRAIAQDLVDRWRRTSGQSAAKALRLVSEIRREGKVVGKQTLVITSGGRLRAECEIDGRRSVVACDGEKCWTLLPGRDVQVISRGKAILDPHFAQAAALSLLVSGHKLDTWGQVQLEGADKADHRLCYRLSATDAETTEQLFVWLSAYDSAGQPHVELVKTGVGIEDDEPIASTLYGDWREAGDLLLPYRRTLVRGLDETSQLLAITNEVATDDLSSSLFELPGGARSDD